MDKEELFVGAVVINTTLPEQLRSNSVITVVDCYDDESVTICYMQDTMRRSLSKSIPINYFLDNWELDLIADTK